VTSGIRIAQAHTVVVAVTAMAVRRTVVKVMERGWFPRAVSLSRRSAERHPARGVPRAIISFAPNLAISYPVLHRVAFRKFSLVADGLYPVVAPARSIRRSAAGRTVGVQSEKQRKPLASA